MIGRESTTAFDRNSGRERGKRREKEREREKEIQRFKGEG